MLAMKFRNAISIFTLAAVFSLSGCMALGKVSGGGWMEGAEGGRANLGFTAAQCAEGWIDGSFTYHDRKADKLQIHGAITNAGLCQGDYDSDLGMCDYCEAIWGGSTLAGCASYQVEFDYVTQGKVKDTGTGFACVVDCGEGINAVFDDGLYIELDTGYSNFGPLMGGNIQAHTCTCTDGLDNDGDGYIDENDPDCVSPNGSENTWQAPPP